jgi:hypothetical protein
MVVECSLNGDLPSVYFSMSMGHLEILLKVSSSTINPTKHLFSEEEKIL